MYPRLLDRGACCFKYWVHYGVKLMGYFKRAECTRCT